MSFTSSTSSMNGQLKAESKQPEVKSLMADFLKLANSEAKDWEEKVVEFLKNKKLDLSIPKLPEMSFEMVGKTESADANFHLWVKVVTHPKLIDYMKTFLIYSCLNENYFPLKFNQEKTLDEALAVYTKTIQQAELKFNYIKLSALTNDVENQILLHIHKLMVIYRRNVTEETQDPFPDLNELEEQDLTRSIRSLLLLISKETLIKRDIKVIEGDHGRERMSTLERAIQTGNFYFVKDILEKGHVTNLGVPILTQWDDEPSPKYTVFDIVPLNSKNELNKTLICLIAQSDACGDFKKLADALADSMPAKKIILDYIKLISEVNAGTGEQLPRALLTIVAGYSLEEMSLFAHPKAEETSTPIQPRKTWCSRCITQ